MSIRIPRLNLFLAMILIIVAYASAACSTMPLHDYLIPTPTHDSKSAEQDMLRPEWQLTLLALNTSDWHLRLMLGEYDIASIWAREMLQNSSNLSLALDEDDFRQVTSQSSLQRFINDLADSIDERYSSRKRDEFMFKYASWLAIRIVELDVGQLDESDVETLMGIASQNLRVANLMANNLGVPLDLREQGQLLAQEILNYKDHPHIGEDIQDWERGVSFALSGRPTPVPTPTLANPAGQDITTLLPRGNALRGEIVHTEEDCDVCHILFPIGPQWRVADNAEERPLQAQFEENWRSNEYGGDAETLVQYVVESIVNPTAFSGNYEPLLMPRTYGETLSRQDLADLVAFLMQIK
ncbi:MAG: hypothetical protein H6644_06730 [Caldilineaceae bacterium]|nr:hypothetical protein [Caldilineaceae bacterium]